MVRLIALDLDGTLLSHEGSVGPLNAAALQEAAVAGVHIVIATGRRHMYALKVLSGVGLEGNTLLVSSNGAVVRTFDSAFVARSLMPLATARWLCDVLGEFRNALVVTFDRTGPMGEDERGALVVEHLDELHSSIGKWMESNAPYIEHVVPLERALEGAAPIQMMLCGTLDRMRRARALLLAYPNVASGKTLSLTSTEYPERDLAIVDILPPGCSKGAAVLALAERLSVDPADVMAIGDNWNDVSMLEVAGWPVLMGNAPADLLVTAPQRGWQVAGECSQQGVAEVVQRAIKTTVEPLAAVEV